MWKTSSNNPVVARRAEKITALRQAGRDGGWDGERCCVSETAGLGGPSDGRGSKEGCSEKGS